jgi:hypothetical protein
VDPEFKFHRDTRLLQPVINLVHLAGTFQDEPYVEVQGISGRRGIKEVAYRKFELGFVFEDSDLLLPLVCTAQAKEGLEEFASRVYIRYLKIDVCEPHSLSSLSGNPGYGVAVGQLLIPGWPPVRDRRHALHLTEKGRSALDMVGRISREHSKFLLAALSEDEQRQLAASLQRVADAHGLTRGVHPGYRLIGRGPRRNRDSAAQDEASIRD